MAIFDWMLPGLSGIKLLRRLRSQKSSLPVLMLTAKSATEDKVTGLDTGADYYTERKLVAIAGKRIKSLSIDYSDSEWSDLVDEAGYPYRQIALPLHTKNDRVWGYLQVGRSMDEAEDYIGIVRRILIGGFPFAIALIGFGAWWLVGKAMMPIYRSYRQIQQFTADAAHEQRHQLHSNRRRSNHSFEIDSYRCGNRGSRYGNWYS